MKEETRTKLIKFLAKFEKKYQSDICLDTENDLIDKALSYAYDLLEVFEDDKRPKFI